MAGANKTTVTRIRTEQVNDLVDQSVLTAEGSMIGHLRKTPALLSSIFVEVTRQLYAADNGLDLKQRWRWVRKPSDASSHIWINAQSVWSDSEPDFRPAIYIALAPISYKSVTGNARSRMGMNLQEAEYHYSRHGSGSVRFIHIGRTEGEAMALVSNTTDLLDAFSDPIREDFCFRTLSVVTAVPPKVNIKEPRERFRGEVVVDFTFMDNWTLKLESPKLKRLVFKAGTLIADELGLETTIM